MLALLWTKGRGSKIGQTGSLNACLQRAFKSYRLKSLLDFSAGMMFVEDGQSSPLTVRVCKKSPLRSRA